LAKAARISQPTAGKIIDELLGLGLIEELADEDAAERPARDSAPRLGRPGRRLRLDGLRPRFLGIELGVEQTRLGCLPLGTNGATPWETAFATGEAPEAWMRKLADRAARLPRTSLWAVLVSVPGVVDEAAGLVLYSPNLHWTERLPLTGLVEGVFGLPVLLVQEIRALALGHLAANPTCQDFLLVDVGEGVGGAVIEGGQLLRHPLPLSAELGHTPVLGNTRVCGCGASGCVETLLSRSGLTRSLAEAGTTGGPNLDTLAAGIGARGVPDWLAASLDALGTIMAGALNVLGLRRAVVTGHLGELPPAVLERLAQAVRRGAVWARFGEVVCESAPRRRLEGLVAAGIDRLLLPATDAGPLPRAVRQRMVKTARTRPTRRDHAPVAVRLRSRPSAAVLQPETPSHP
jgi:glucokinase